MVSVCSEHLAYRGQSKKYKKTTLFNMALILTFLGHKKLVLSVCHSQFIIQAAMNTRGHLTDEQHHLALARLQVGSRQSNVARELGVSQSVISRLVARHRATGSVRDRPRSGAPRVTDHNDDQYLRTYALRHR